MKHLLLFVILITVVCNCNSSKNLAQAEDDKLQIKSEDTLTLSSKALEYDIVIIEPGFQSWLISTAKPEGYYTKNYLERKNWRYVTEWNTRVLQPQRYNPNLYELRIDYRHGIDYGYDLNYKLYNYFIFFQNNYKQNLLGGVVPIN